jgi:hypothetical protein
VRAKLPTISTLYKQLNKKKNNTRNSEATAKKIGFSKLLMMLMLLLLLLLHLLGNSFCQHFIRNNHRVIRKKESLLSFMSFIIFVEEIIKILQEQ